MMSTLHSMQTQFVRTRKRPLLCSPVRSVNATSASGSLATWCPETCCSSNSDAWSAPDSRDQFSVAPAAYLGTPRRHARCVLCGDSHTTSECTAERPRCINCAGTHATLEPRCPTSQLEKRAANLLSSSKERFTRHKALELVKARASSLAVQEECGPTSRLSVTVQAGLSFRDALNE